MKYTISHRTEYEYDVPVGVCHNIIRLLPRNTHTQHCTSSAVTILPKPDVINNYEDFFGNKVIYFSIDKDHEKLDVHITSEIEKKSVPEFDGDNFSTVIVKDIQRDLNAGVGTSFEIRQFVFPTPMTMWNKRIRDYALESFQPDRPVYEATKELMTRIFTDFKFKSGVTSIATPVAAVMEERTGVCQDFTHIAISCLRSAGLPARYVSGYIETLSPKGQEKLVGADASHAWFSVYITGMGWIDFDPTNNMIPADQHLTIGWGRDYADIAPLKGIILSSGAHELKVAVDVKRG